MCEIRCEIDMFFVCGFFCFKYIERSNYGAVWVLNTTITQL